MSENGMNQQDVIKYFGGNMSLVLAVLSGKPVYGMFNMSKMRPE
jgi:hypothetical protein